MPDATPSSNPRPRRSVRRATHDSSATGSSPAVSDDGAAIQADHVAVEMGAVGRVDAETLEVHRGAVGGARATTVDVQQGALGGALAGRVSVRQGYARAVIAREVALEQSAARLVVAAEARIERATGIGVLIARRVSGDVRVLVDWRGALAFGAAFGVVAGLLGRLRRR
jgi:hypothetical protein